MTQPAENATSPTEICAAESPAPGPQGEPEVSLGQVFKRLGPAGILAVIAAVVPALSGILLLINIGPVGNWFLSHQQLGIVLYALGFAVFAGLALLPTYSQSILGGWAFGFTAGFPAALVGFFGGSLIGYDVARAASRERAMKLLRENPKWIAVRNALVADHGEARFWKTLGMVALIRLPPNSPFAITNLVMAAVKVPRLPYALGTLIGMAPRTGVAVYIASLIKGEISKEAIKEARPDWVLPVTIALALVVLGTVGFIAKRALDRITRPTDASAPPKELPPEPPEPSKTA